MTDSPPSNPARVVLVGLGHRTIGYGHYAERDPSAMQVVGVADPDDRRRAAVAERFNIPPDRQYHTAEDLAAAGRFADAAINGTMDRQHLSTTLPLLRAGYDVLLEKPIATSIDELGQLVQAVRETGRHLMICHVLRYAPFYAAVRQRVSAGEIGKIIHIRTAEYVSYHHMATGFVRGKWNRREVNPILLSKCCHDLDVICWMKSGHRPRRVASFAGRDLFKAEAAPAGAGSRCLTDCQIEAQCPYSAKRLYVDQNLWDFYAWQGIEHLSNPTDEEKCRSLATDNPYGRCVWDCDNDVADHQSVLIEFDDGSTAQHTLVGGVSRPAREIHLLGTAGEIQGRMEDTKFVLRKANPDAPGHYDEQVIDIVAPQDMHGGGDLRLIEDFVRLVRGQTVSASVTHLNDSIASHLIAFTADRAMQTGDAVDVPAMNVDPQAAASS